MSKYNKNKLNDPQSKSVNTSRIVSLGCNPNTWTDSWLKLIADLSGIVDQQAKTRKNQYD